MTNEQIIEQIKVDYEVVLEDFRVYNSAEELFENEKKNGNLSEITIETNGATLGEEDNVFRLNELWIYSSSWYDLDWDN